MKNSTSTFTDRLDKYLRIISTLTWIIIGGVVYIYYGASFLDEPKRKYDVDKIVNLNNNIGDQYLIESKFELAKEAYSNALELSPHNYRANFGLAKAKIFDPFPDKEPIDIETIQLRINLLEKEFFTDGSFPEDDVHLLLYRSILERFKGNSSNAIYLIRKAIKIDPSNADAHTLLGYTYQLSKYNFKMVGDAYKKAVKLNPNSSIHQINAGYYHLYMMQLDTAAKHLQTSIYLSSNYTNNLGMGYAYRAIAENEVSKNIHLYLLNSMQEEKQKNKNTRFSRGEIMLNYFPEILGDTITSKKYILLRSDEQKEAIIQYELSIDYALLGNQKLSKRYFESGVDTFFDSDYINYYLNQIKFIENVTLNSNSSLKWLKESFMAISRKP